MISGNNTRVNVVFTKDEDEVLAKMAEYLGISKSGLIHHCTMSALASALQLEKVYNNPNLSADDLNNEIEKVLNTQVNSVQKWTRHKV